MSCLRALVLVGFSSLLLGSGGGSGSLLRAQQGAAEGPLKAPASSTMTNESVVKMVKAGLGDSLVIQTVNTQPGDYATDADSLVRLKESGVSDAVISAMVRVMSTQGRRLLTTGGGTQPVEPIGSAQGDAAIPGAISPQVNEVGAYYKDRHGNWIPIEPERVQIRSGGFLKSTVTNGIIKQDRNGRVNGRESKLTLATPIQILLYTPDGVEANDYNLIRFRLHEKSREFRLYTGGVFHSTSGADRDDVPFTAVRTAPRTYEFTIDPKVGGGEYGILPVATNNIANGGKIYTFAITE
jgi:hypothetical protein